MFYLLCRDVGTSMELFYIDIKRIAFQACEIEYTQYQ